MEGGGGGEDSACLYKLPRKKVDKMKSLGRGMVERKMWEGRIGLCFKGC